MSEKTKIEFVFDNPEAAQHFISWLCESGEQDYWIYMESRESESEGDITVLDFDYWGGTNNGAEFGKHPIIAECGRRDK